MPSLPRIRRTRARDTVVTASAPQSPPAELSAAGLTWIHLDSPTLMHAQELAERYGWHPLDVEDVMSKRQRPKVDDYTDEGYLFAVLHFPVYDRAIQRRIGDPPERVRDDVISHIRLRYRVRTRLWCDAAHWRRHLGLAA